MDNNCMVLSEDPYNLVRTDILKMFVLHHDEDGA